MSQTSHSNEQRIASARAALVAYQRAKSRQRPSLPPPTDETLIDILTDLRHWATAGGTEFANAARISADHFEVESSSQAE